MRVVRFVAAALWVVMTSTVMATVDPVGAAGRDPWLALLDRVPAAGTFDETVIINDYKAARSAAGLSRSSDRVKDLVRLEEATGIAPSELILVEGPGDPLADELGIRSRDVERDLAAGSPPDDLILLEGSIDADKVKRAVEADDNFSDLLETVRYAGEQYYTWGSNRVDPQRRTPVRPLGNGGNLAVDPPSAAWSDDAQSIEASIDATAGEERSLADNRDIKAVAVALHDQDAYSAFLSVLEIAPGADTGGPTPLAPYEAISIGPGLSGTDQPEVTIVLAYGDGATAREQATRLQAIAEGGTTINGDPWNELITVDDIAAQGRLVIGRFRTDSPRLWLQVVLRRDSLLATT